MLIVFSLTHETDGMWYEYKKDVLKGIVKELNYDGQSVIDCGTDERTFIALASIRTTQIKISGLQVTINIGTWMVMIHITSVLKMIIGSILGTTLKMKIMTISIK